MKKPLIAKSIIVFATIMFAICMGISYAFTVDEETNLMSASVNGAPMHEANKTETEYNDVVSYKSLFRAYYDEAKSIAKEMGNAICSFDTFCNNYYNYNIDIDEYTNAIGYGYDLNKIEEMSLYSSGSSGSSSGDAAYILSPDDYDVTPKEVFKREPSYTDSYDYSVIEEGDIVYDTLYPPESAPFFKTGHCGLVYNIHKPSEYGNYIQTIDAVGGGVQFGMLDDTRIIRWKVIVLRVVGADKDKKEKVKDFCHEQLGKKYSLTASLKADRTADSWYCSQLLYVAYKDVGIDIGVRKDGNGKDVNVGSSITPKDIYRSYNTSERRLNCQYLQLAVTGKSGSYWKIRITNNNSFTVPIQYNKKMCFKNDAIFWQSGLKHITDANIAPNDSIDVDIQTNVFADFITVSYKDGNKRYVSYGNNLDKKTKTLTVRYNTVEE